MRNEVRTEEKNSFRSYRSLTLSLAIIIPLSPIKLNLSCQTRSSHVQPQSRYLSSNMRFLATITVLLLAGLGLTSPVKQQAQATCAICSQGCLRTDTGECYPNWPESTCSIYSDVSYLLPS